MIKNGHAFKIPREDDESEIARLRRVWLEKVMSGEVKGKASSTRVNSCQDCPDLLEVSQAVRPAVPCHYHETIKKAKRLEQIRATNI